MSKRLIGMIMVLCLILGYSATVHADPDDDRYPPGWLRAVIVSSAMDDGGQADE